MMPTIRQHAEISRKRTAKDYKQLHEWMDANPRKKEERPDIGRIYQHGKMMEKKYGPEGLQEYLQHIHDDSVAKFNHLKEAWRRPLPGPSYSPAQ
jgi:hypothetical protein